MATTIAELSSFLKNNELRFQAEEENSRIVFSLGTECYTDTDGDKSLFLVAQLEENGEFFKLFAPKCYSYPEGPYKEALFQACLMLSWQTKMLQFEYDVTDGEVRAVIEFPLEDAPMSERQFMRCVGGLANLIDKYDPMIRSALETGRIKGFEEDQDTAEFMQAFGQFMEERKKAETVKKNSPAKKTRSRKKAGETSAE